MADFNHPEHDHGGTGPPWLDRLLLALVMILIVLIILTLWLYRAGWYAR